jgi:hypothetical protein
MEILQNDFEYWGTGVAKSYPQKLWITAGVGYRAGLKNRKLVMESQID